MNLSLDEIQQEIIKLQDQLVVLEELEDLFFYGIEGGESVQEARSLESHAAGSLMDNWNRRCNLKEVYHGTSRKAPSQ